jgi:hypothetical protein
MPASPPPRNEEAEVIALKALGFLASDQERLERFMSLSGLTLSVIRQTASDPGFLAGVLDHLLADQTLLLAFAENAGLTPNDIQKYRRQLPGANLDF